MVEFIAEMLRKKKDLNNKNIPLLDRINLREKLMTLTADPDEYSNFRIILDDLYEELRLRKRYEHPPGVKNLRIGSYGPMWPSTSHKIP